VLLKPSPLTVMMGMMNFRVWVERVK